MMNGVHPVLMLCQARAPFPWPVDSHPRVEKKYSWWSAGLREVRSRRIQIRKTIRASRKSYPSSCISTPWARRWETSPLLTIGSGLGLKSVLIVWLGSQINPGYQQVQKEPRGRSGVYQRRREETCYWPLSWFHQGRWGHAQPIKRDRAGRRRVEWTGALATLQRGLCLWNNRFPDFKSIRTEFYDTWSWNRI